MPLRSIKELRPYQRRGARHIYREGSTGLLVDMGLGKTATTLTALWKLMRERVVRSLLVAAPKGVVESEVWPDEAKQWRHLRHLKTRTVLGNARERTRLMSPGADVYITHYDFLKWLAYEYDGPLPDMLALDESSFIKKPNSRRFKTLRFKLLKKFKIVVILTATPRPNTLLEFWTQIYVLDGGKRLGTSYTRFKKRYFYTEDYHERKWIPRPGSEKRITALISDLCIRLEDSDWLKMPKIIRTFIPVNLPPRVQTMYDKFERNMFLELDDGREIESSTAATLAGQCHQIANGALYDDPEDKDSFTVLHDRKLDALSELLEADNRNVMIVYWYRHDRERILQRHPDCIVPKKGGLKAIKDDWNAGRINRLLVHPGNVGHGLNMQYGGNFIVFFSLTYSYEKYHQLIGRLRRADNPSDHIDVAHIYARRTADEAVRLSLRSKRAGQEQSLLAIKEYRRLKYGDLD